MEIAYKPHLNSEFETLIERIHPPSVCIDNQSCHDCTLVKVDSANKHGILLEMVQVLTDLDLVISKSYICSDGGWFMDVFHVTDHQGNKITDESLILYIQQAMCANRRAKKDVQTAIGRQVKPRHISAEGTALEITGTDRPGLLSEISAVLAELECNVTAAVVWTHNTRVACIIHIEDEIERAPITDLNKIAYVQAQLESVVEAHHREGERRSVRLTAPAVGGTHTERRLHQLMSADRDYEVSSGGSGGADIDDLVYEKGGRMPDRYRYRTKVTIDYCKERGYSVVNVRCRDRPKLLFDTVCTLTDLEYVVFHASISSKCSVANQEYYIRHMDGCWMESECERRRVIQCLVAATERRVSHGLRLDVCTRNRVGLLSDITRAFRENGLSITRAEIGTHGEKATGSFYVIDTSGHEVKSNTVEMVREQIGGTILMVNKPSAGRSTTMRCSKGSEDVDPDDSPKFSLGNMLWSHIERISNNFRPVRS